MNKTALITGATSGIGLASAHRLASSGYSLYLSGRRTDRLEALTHELRTKYPSQNFEFATMDVRNREEVRSVIGMWSLPSLDLLLNNAGLAAGADPFQTGDYINWDRMIDTNLKGLIYVTEACIPYLKKGNHPMIINIDSTAGKEAYPGGNVYCATKHGVDALTKGMRMDLLNDGIRVGMVSPGLVETEFSIVRFDGDKQKADSVYSGMTPLTPEDVAESVHFMATQPTHVSILDIVIMPTDQASSTQVKRAET
ncbi:MAG: hypothetical protein SchgKO_03210 [Schleiferiaceae bacterium]